MLVCSGCFLFWLLPAKAASVLSAFHWCALYGRWLGPGSGNSASSPPSRGSSIAGSAWWPAVLYKQPLPCCTHRYLGPANDYVGMKNLSNYNTTASSARVYGWWPGACTTAYSYICEVPMASYQCPPSPPQSPAPPADIYACEPPTFALVNLPLS
jgi:hypothetical protein